MRDQLHYRGDHTNFDPDHVMGPDMFGAHYRVAAAEHDPAADVTTMTLAPITPQVLAERAATDFAKATSMIGAKIRIAGLFGGRL